MGEKKDLMILLKPVAKFLLNLWCWHMRGDDEHR